MVSLTLRGIPSALLERVRLFARGERRSVNSEILTLLEEGVRGRLESQARSEDGPPVIRARSHVWAELCGRWPGDSAANAALLEDVLSLRPISPVAKEDTHASF